jgi:hypothetical protein
MYGGVYIAIIPDRYGRVYIVIMPVRCGRVCIAIISHTKASTYVTAIMAIIQVISLATI